MLHQDVVTTRLSPPTGMYLPSPQPPRRRVLDDTMAESFMGDVHPPTAATRGVRALILGEFFHCALSELGSNCFKRGGLVKHLLGSGGDGRVFRVRLIYV